MDGHKILLNHNKMIKYYSILVLTVCFFLHIQAQTQCDWELEKDESGIQVYTCKPEGSSFKAFKIITEVTANNLMVVPAIILDVNNYIKWMPDIRKAELIKKLDDGHDIHYVRTAAPWPVNDRDGIYEQKTTYHKEEKRIVIELHAVKEFDYFKEDNVVRMTVGSGFWEITDAGNGKFKLYYEFHAEPGGRIPAWLANTSVVNIPFEMMENLKAMVDEGSYNDAQLNFKK